MKRRIVHVSADFPDSIDMDKTKVVRSLVDLTNADFDHVVYSLNRQTPPPAKFLTAMLRGGFRPSLKVATQPFDYGTALTYAAPPKGIFHASMLTQLGDWLARQITRDARPDLIVGHKLAVEGIAVRRAASLLGIPYAISIQGDTDTKILAARPDLRSELRRVFHDAAVVFPFSPWAMRKVEAALGGRIGTTILLPCPTDLDVPIPPRIGQSGIVSVFHLKNHERKNLKAMVEATALLERDGDAPLLTVIGGGSETDFERCQKLAQGVRQVEFAGPMTREPLRARMNEAAGFVMPSLRESFGLVFIEALFSGLPIIYPAGTSVDGYLDDLPFALRIDPRDSAAIAAAMRHVVNQEQSLKTSLAQWQESEDAARFKRSTIGADFARGLAEAAA